MANKINSALLLCWILVGYKMKDCGAHQLQKNKQKKEQIIFKPPLAALFVQMYSFRALNSYPVQSSPWRALTVCSRAFGCLSPSPCRCRLLRWHGWVSCSLWPFPFPADRETAGPDQGWRCTDRAPVKEVGFKEVCAELSPPTEPGLQLDTVIASSHLTVTLEPHVWARFPPSPHLCVESLNATRGFFNNFDTSLNIACLWRKKSDKGKK